MTKINCMIVGFSFLGCSLVAMDKNGLSLEQKLAIGRRAESMQPSVSRELALWQQNNKLELQIWEQNNKRQLISEAESRLWRDAKLEERRLLANKG